MANRSPASLFVCEACGGHSPKWQGQCPHCAAWNSLSERRPIRAANARSGATAPGSAPEPARLDEAQAGAPERLATGQSELDRVLGGGIVRGSVILLGGDPGIGKSTLLLQVAAHVAGGASAAHGAARGGTVPAARAARSGASALTGVASAAGASPALAATSTAGPPPGKASAAGDTVLYASGEESLAQIGMRAQRLAVGAERLRVAVGTDLDAILAQAAACNAALLVVDSIQTMQLGAVASSAGAVSQLRECTAELVRVAKSTGVAVVIVGHVTKEGALAGPRVLEHLVDTVLYFESEASSRFRVVRATKSRFGPVGELGFFAMSATGLKAVRNPAALFLARAPEPAAGSIVMVAREGGRPLLIELQGLVDRMVLGAPRRIAQGLDANRLAMLLAVLHRHGGVSLQQHDVFANIVGGLEIRETASDLPVLLALASSLADRALDRTLVAFGEVGLTGEVRPVAYGEERLREAQQQGFKRAVVPAGNVPRRPLEGIEVIGVGRIGEALAAAGPLAGAGQAQPD